MNGRFFGGKRIAVQEWDGHTNYQIEETDKARVHARIVNASRAAGA